jgi:ribosomal RNA-processing protein 8
MTPGDPTGRKNGLSEGKSTGKPSLNDRSIIKSSSATGGKGNSRPLSALQEKLRRRLASGQFRELNEQLYSCTGAQAACLMQSKPELFAAYHSGYADQARRWPFNPLDRVLEFLHSQPTDLRVADLGCGEARLCSEAPQKIIHSFDLVAANDRVTACDMAKLPLKDSSVDIAVFCLSLMGTNYGEFLAEARRTVAPGGWVLIAEVSSRFENHDPATFKTAVEAVGFRCDSVHPFVVGVLPASSDRGAPSSGKSRKRGAKSVPTATAGRRVASSPNSSASSFGSSFFKLFAFQTTKRKPDDGPDNAHGRRTSSVSKKGGKALPVLKPCLYKKR